MVDLSLFGLPAAAAPGLAVHRLATTPYRVVLAEDHPLARRKEIGLAEIATEHFLDTPVGFGNRDVLDSALAARGIVRDIRAEVTETSAIPVFVATGLGIALLPEMLLPPVDGVVTVALAEQIDWDLSVISPRTPSAPAAVLIEDLIAAYR